MLLVFLSIKTSHLSVTSIAYYQIFCNRGRRIELHLPGLFCVLSETERYYIAHTALELSVAGFKLQFLLP